MNLAVAHWHSRFHSRAPLAPALPAAWHEALTGLDEDALLDGLAHADEWLLIRHLPMRARWRADTGGGAGDWLVSLRRALEAKLAAGDGDVLRYADLRHAWSDLFYRLACGERARVWAWKRMGLLPADVTPGEELPTAAPRLAREPQLIWPVLRRLLDAESGHAAFSAVLRALPPPAWRELLTAEPRTRAYVRAVGDGDADGARSGAAGVGTTGVGTTGVGAIGVGGASARAWPVDQAVDPAGVQALLRWLDRQPWLGARHAATVATLLAAMTWPAGGRGEATLRARLALARERCVAGVAGRDARHAPARSNPAGLATRSDPAPGAVAIVGGDPPSARVAPSVRPAPESAGLPELAELPELAVWRASAHAGALFWLNRLAREGFPEALLGASAGADATGDFLAALADALALPADDAARAVLVAPGRARPPAASMRARVEARVAAWEDWLATAAPDLPAPRVATISRREGQLRLEPGWIELRLPLDSVDTRVRRLGLDLDPGWLPWLGCVVRIRYCETQSQNPYPGTAARERTLLPSPSRGEGLGVGVDPPVPGKKSAIMGLQGVSPAGGGGPGSGKQAGRIAVSSFGAAGRHDRDV